MKSNRLTFTENIIGWLVDLYFQMSSTEKNRKPSKFQAEIVRRKK
jgi:hypothetical protein